MPNLKAHMESSKKRTGKSYEELHRWMDDGVKYLGRDHRFERHSGAYIPHVEKVWKEEGVMEFFMHIIEDFLSSAHNYHMGKFKDKLKDYSTRVIWYSGDIKND